MAHYYVKNGGSDSADGLSDANAWATIAKVNAQTFSAGDIVSFNRGDTWREQLLPDNGSSIGYITYTAYGTGAKPIIQGSSDLSNSPNWIDEENNIWHYDMSQVIGDELSPNIDFESSSTGWSLYTNGATASFSRTTTVGEFNSGAAGGKVVCTTDGTTIELKHFNITLEANMWYVFSFYAKADVSFNISDIYINKNNSPWTAYTATRVGNTPTITSSFIQYFCFIKTNFNAPTSDAKINIEIAGMGDSNIFYIDDVSFKKAVLSDIPITSCNILFNNDETLWGRMRLNEVDLTQQGDFWSGNSINGFAIKIYSTSNPGIYYSNIENLNGRDIVDGTPSYVIFDSFDLKYGGNHGFGFGDSSNLEIRNCDLRFIGGYKYNAQGGRYGNGIEIYGSALNIIVEKNYLYGIWDAALTIQSSNQESVSNCYFRNNIIINPGLAGWEMFFRNANSSIDGLYVENNTILGVGNHFSHLQRFAALNYQGAICLYDITSNISNYYIRNNILSINSYTGSDVPNTLWLGGSNPGIPAISNITLDNNLHYTQNNELIYFLGTLYNKDQFTIYQLAKNQDLHSISADPLLNADYSLKTESPCIDAGAKLSDVLDDYIGTMRSEGSSYDIGAYEYIFGLYYYNSATSEWIFKTKPLNIGINNIVRNNEQNNNFINLVDNSLSKTITSSKSNFKSVQITIPYMKMTDVFRQHFLDCINLNYLIKLHINNTTDSIIGYITDYEEEYLLRKNIQYTQPKITIQEFVNT